MKTQIIAILSSLVLASTACGVAHKAGSAEPEMLADDCTVWTISGVAFNNADFSGLCFTKDGKRFVAAFNSAGLYWMNIPQKEGETLHFDPLDAEGAKFREVKRDCEAVTLDKKTGDIYYVQEREGSGFAGQSIYKISAPAYNKQTLVVSFDKETVPPGNNGLEGLTWLGNDNLIAGREGGGFMKIKPMMIFYSVSKGITEKVVLPSEIKQIAEIVYDDVRDCLWILDGDYDKILYRCDMRGEVLNRYPITDIVNAEALVLDRKHKCIWIGSDEEPSKLYRIGFKNL